MALPYPHDDRDDLANDLFAVTELLGLDDEAVSSGRTLVTGAWFGALAGESVMLTLCEGQPPAARARVDVVPATDSEAGQIGSSFAATIIDVLVTGGRIDAHNRLIRTGLGSHPERLTLPYGSSATPAAVRAATWKSPAAPRSSRPARPGRRPWQC